VLSSLPILASGTHLRTFQLTPVYVMIDGGSDDLYGQCSLGLGGNKDVLVASGVGVTFTLGPLDDLVGRIVRHQHTCSECAVCVEFAWIVRSISELFPFPSRIHYSTVSHFKAASSGSCPCFWTLWKWQWYHRLTFTSPSL
jgi:hypothetical protein